MFVLLLVPSLLFFPISTYLLLLSLLEPELELGEARLLRFFFLSWDSLLKEVI